MIYLIDDNRRDQQKEYNCDFLNKAEFSAFFKVIYKLAEGTDVAVLKDAKCILIHSSFPDFNAAGQAIEAKTTIYEAILALSVQHKIPTVVFTNSILDSDYNRPNSDTLIRINKRLFYSNLEDFLQYYKANNTVELKIFTYGKNFVAHDLAVIAAQISSLIQTYGLNEGLEEITKQVNAFAEKSGTTEAVKNKLDAAIKSSEPTTVFLIYLEKIIQSFFRHGRNIYP